VLAVDKYHHPKLESSRLVESTSVLGDSTNDERPW